jgi:hypothetical protein
MIHILSHDSSASLPIPPQSKMKVIILALLLIPLAAGTSSAEESSKQSNDFLHRLRALIADEGSEPVAYFSLSASFEGIKGLSKTTPSAKSGKTGSMKSASKAEKAQCVGEFVDFGKELPLDAAKKLKKDICSERKLIFNEVLSCVDSYIEAIYGNFIPGNGCDSQLFFCSTALFGSGASFFQGTAYSPIHERKLQLGGFPFIPASFFNPNSVECEWAGELLLVQGGLKSLNL